MSSCARKGGRHEKQGSNPLHQCQRNRTLVQGLLDPIADIDNHNIEILRRNSYRNMRELGFTRDGVQDMVLCEQSALEASSRCVSPERSLVARNLSEFTRIV